jgi:hypothetical protein
VRKSEAIDPTQPIWGRAGEWVLYKQFKPQSLCIKCNNERAHERSSSFKKWAVEYKDGKCVKCGYDRCLDALQFHHRDHSTKEVTPARMKLWSREKARLELDKCDLVCANCHAEIHYEMRSVHPAIASPPVPEAMAEHRP